MIGRRMPALLLGILTAQLALAAWIVWRLSFVFAGRRYFCLFDDAMISMTYARNLTEGHGLNWARFGAPVEGFSHPLWLGFMIAANLLPLPLRLRGLPIQALSIALLAAVVLVTWLLSRRYFTTSSLAGSWLPAVCLAAFDGPLLVWSVLGMESALQALLCLLAVQLALDIAEAGRDRHVALFGVLAAACLLRMDMAILAVLVEGYVLLFGRPVPRRSWLGGLAVFAALTGAYAAFRLAYFHDWLPNTYYLKLHGIPLVPRLLRGWSIALDTLPGLAIPLGLAAAAALVPGRRRRPVLLALTLFLAYFLYSIYLGGDAFEGVARANRFVNFAAPLLFLAAGSALDRLRAWAVGARAVEAGRLGAGEPGSGAGARSTRQPEAHEPEARESEARESGARGVEAGKRPAGRLMPGADLAGLGLVTLLLVLAVNALGAPAETLRDDFFITKPLYARRYEKNLARLRRLEQIVRPGALVATVWAGLPAFYSDYRLLDLLGYNDRVIARLPPAEPLTTENFASYEPGHEKWSYAETFKGRPDAFLSTWSLDGAQAEALMAREGYVEADGFWLRCGSPFVDWQRVHIKGEKGGRGGC
jgi:hypothetical protein